MPNTDSPGLSHLVSPNYILNNTFRMHCLGHPMVTSFADDHTPGARVVRQSPLYGAVIIKHHKRARLWQDWTTGSALVPRRKLRRTVSLRHSLGVFVSYQVIDCSIFFFIFVFALNSLHVRVLCVLCEWTHLSTPPLCLTRIAHPIPRNVPRRRRRRGHEL